MGLFIESVFARYYEQFPLVMIDIGASGGLQTRWKRAERYLQVIGFEPDGRAFSDLITSSGSKPTKYLNMSLLDKRITVDFHLTRRQTNSSIFSPNRKFLDGFPESERFDVLECVQIEADSLDNQLRKLGINDVDFIKVDTQGSELSILKGSNGILGSSVFGLEIEVEFTQIYLNQPLFSEVDGFVRNLGFQLFDLKLHYWKRSVGVNCGNPKGQIIFADALYLRDVDTFIGLLDKIEDHTLKKSKVLRAISICNLYGYIDYALEILHKLGWVFDEGERQMLEERLCSVPLSSKLPAFRGRGRMANALHRLWRIVRPTHGQWWSSSGELGNLE